jgi:hypothetical protein
MTGFGSASPAGADAVLDLGARSRRAELDKSATLSSERVRISQRWGRPIRRTRSENRGSERSGSSKGSTLSQTIRS